MLAERIDSGTRRKLRQSLGSRVQRRAGTNRPGQPKPRQLLAAKIEQWKREQVWRRYGLKAPEMP